MTHAWPSLKAVPWLKGGRLRRVAMCTLVASEWIDTIVEIVRYK